MTRGKRRRVPRGHKPSLYNLIKREHPELAQRIERSPPVGKVIYDNDETSLMATQYCGPGRQLQLALDYLNITADRQASFTADEALEAGRVLLRWAVSQGAKLGGSDGWERNDMDGTPRAFNVETGAVIWATRSEVDGTLRLFVEGATDPCEVPQTLAVELLLAVDE